MLRETPINTNDTVQFDAVPAQASMSGPLPPNYNKWPSIFWRPFLSHHPPDSWATTVIPFPSSFAHAVFICMGSGGFGHVQHVRPNKGPTKRSPHKKSGKFLHAGKMGDPRV